MGEDSAIWVPIYDGEDLFRTQHHRELFLRDGDAHSQLDSEEDQLDALVLQSATGLLLLLFLPLHRENEKDESSAWHDASNSSSCHGVVKID